MQNKIYYAYNYEKPCVKIIHKDMHRIMILKMVNHIKWKHACSIITWNIKYHCYVKNADLYIVIKHAWHELNNH